MKFVSVPKPRKFLGLAAVVVIDGVVFGSTEAGKVSSFMLIVGFLLLMITFYYLLYGLLALVRLYGIGIMQKRRLASSLTALLACLVALQSVGELNLRDILLLLPLGMIGYAYSLYNRLYGTDSYRKRRQQLAGSAAGTASGGGRWR